MTAILAEVYPSDAVDPSNRDKFFNPSREIPKLKKLINDRECLDHQTFPPPCDVNLFFGLFFDGTNNNLKNDKDLHAHSNVARLYQAFPGGKDANGSEAWPELVTKYKGFFRIYIPGVGTKFDEVRDTGEGSMRTKGLAFAYKGEDRIIWALVETINNIHAYYTDSKLIKQDEFNKKFNKLMLPAGVLPSDEVTETFAYALKKLRDALNVYLPVGEGKSKTHGVVRNIYLSVFGFSRGAAEARAFANWFVWLCKLDASLGGSANLTLGTIPVTFDFIGLFDTVASVGLANSFPFIPVDGHSVWSDSDKSLRISDASEGPAQCLHLVSAHEIRRSFPMDSVMYRGVMPSNCKEVVFPGVHSDVGGGYAPMEQGRGKDAKGADLLSRIALAVMYRAARLAGVPIKLEDAPESVKESFKVDPSLIQVFNAYIQSCSGEKVSANTLVIAPLHELMAQQHKVYIQWRKKMRGENMLALPSFKASDKHDRTDIEMANKELEAEIRDFESWRSWEGDDFDRPYARPEWKAIAKYWDQPAPPSMITDIFEQYVHDSRAWFKPFGKDIPDLRFDMERLLKREEEIIEYQNHPVGEEPLSLTKTEIAQVTQYKKYMHTDVRQGIPVEKEGREGSIIGGGFLRYRKVYMGSDSYKPVGAVYAGLVSKSGLDKQNFASKQRTDRKRSA